MEQLVKEILLKSALVRKFAELIKKQKNSMSILEFSQDMKEYNRMLVREEWRASESERLRILNEKYQEAGNMGEYFWQDLLVARLIFNDGPEIHYDIGSRVDGFIGHLLSFRKDNTTIMLDIRPLKNAPKGLCFVQADATNLENIEDESIESLSSLHAVEHFGLGRYGDPIDPEACFKAMKAFQRVIMPGGKLYFSVPCGCKDVVHFNAHRIFKPHTVTKEFDKMKLLSFYYVLSDEVVHLAPEEFRNEDFKFLGNSAYGHAGIFIFEKKAQE